jgi:hypothetical protein
MIRVLFDGASARVVLEPSHASWLAGQLRRGAPNRPPSAGTAAKIDAAVKANAPTIAFDTDERAALLAVLATKPDELSGELLLLYRELRDKAARDPL